MSSVCIQLGFSRNAHTFARPKQLINSSPNYTPQNNLRTNAINYNIDASCVECILKTNFTI